MLFADAVACLSLELRLPDLRIADDGTCALRVGETSIALLPHPERQGLALLAHVGNIAGEHFALRMEQLLAGNLFEDGPVSSVLGMDPSGDVYLSQHLREGAFGAPALVTVFRRFVRRAQAWQQRLAAAPGSASPPSAPQGPSHGRA